MQPQLITLSMIKSESSWRQHKTRQFLLSKLTRGFRWRHSSSIIWSLITKIPPHVCLAYKPWNTASKRDDGKTCYAVQLFVCVCACDRVGVPCSLYGQVYHSESAHSLHCGAVCGPHRVRVGWQGASRIKTRAANRKWACKDKMRTAWLQSVYECHFPQFSFLSSHFFPSPILIHLDRVIPFGCTSTHVHTAQA